VNLDSRIPAGGSHGVVPGAPVALLTGGIDRPYTFGLAMELISKGVLLEIIGSDSVDFPEFHTTPGLTFLNLQGSQSPANILKKLCRLSAYYFKLIGYALTARSRVFHILWNNKLEMLDRTILTLFFRLLQKRIVLTVHNVNAAKRDSRDSLINRLTLRIQYQLAHHIFVHSEPLKAELHEDFHVRPDRITVIPFGINNAVPNTDLSRDEAKIRLGTNDGKKTILFFGRITKYKGLGFLVSAFKQILATHDDVRLIIAGRPENDFRGAWNLLRGGLDDGVAKGQILVNSHHIPDEETEVYFKAADVLVLPYERVYQSGVLFLSYSFGLPVLAADVGSLRDEIVEGRSGFVFRPGDAGDLAKTLEHYFASDLFLNLEKRRQEIKDFAVERHSWDKVGKLTTAVYAAIGGAVAKESRSATPRSLR
jgi:glycosyltransferase involved in cell wall biosynthesis